MIAECLIVCLTILVVSVMAYRLILDKLSDSHVATDNKMLAEALGRIQIFDSVAKNFSERIGALEEKYGKLTLLAGQQIRNRPL